MGQTKDDWIVSLSYFEKKQFMFFLCSRYQPYSFWRILVWNLNVLASWEKFDIYLILSLGSEKKKIGSLIKQHVCLFIPSIPPRVAGSFQSSDRPLPSFLKVISQSAASGCRKCHVGFWVYKGWESHSGYICSLSVWFWVVTPYCQHYSSLLLGRAIIVLGWLTQRPLKTMKLIPLVFFCEDYSTEHGTEKNSSKIPQTIAPERNLFFRWH